MNFITDVKLGLPFILTSEKLNTPSLGDYLLIPDIEIKGSGEIKISSMF